MVDIALINGTIWTGNSQQAWAEALSVRGDKIVKVGSTKEIKDSITYSTRTADLEGDLVLPGLTDCHTHFINGGFTLQRIQLRSAGSSQEFISPIQAKARELQKGDWILGGRWDHEQFTPSELPSKEWIDAVTPENPVCVHRLDGHMVLVNSLALRISGVNKETPDPAGGEILKDSATGEPTGILKDAAIRLVYDHIPKPSFRDKLKVTETALNHAAEKGVTSIHDMSDASSFQVYEQLAKQGKLTARFAVYLPITDVDAEKLPKLKSSVGNNSLKFAGLKGFVDGSLGSTTAYFFEPYTDNPQTCGLLHAQMLPEGIMEQRILKADQAGLQVAVHAIGDKANSILLDIYTEVESQNGKRDRRWRIEHAQHLQSEDMVRIGKLGIICSMQPYHLIDDGCWAKKRIGKERLQTAYAFHSLLNNGVTLAFGSDWPVAPLDPLAGIYAAVTRRTTNGKNPQGLVPKQKLSLEEAVKCYTVDSAYAEFSELLKGTIEEGKLADIVVLDRNIFKVPPEQLLETGVKMTIVGGKVVYEK